MPTAQGGLHAPPARATSKVVHPIWALRRDLDRDKLGELGLFLTTVRSRYGAEPLISARWNSVLFGEFLWILIRHPQEFAEW